MPEGLLDVAVEQAQQWAGFKGDKGVYRHFVSPSLA
jgi:hypothetical protein